MVSNFAVEKFGGMRWLWKFMVHAISHLVCAWLRGVSDMNLKFCLCSLYCLQASVCQFRGAKAEVQQWAVAWE